MSEQHGVVVHKKGKSFGLWGMSSGATGRGVRKQVGKWSCHKHQRCGSSQRHQARATGMGKGKSGKRQGSLSGGVEGFGGGGGR